MYTQAQKPFGDAYIPSSYRGNALYFEKLPCEDDADTEREEKKTDCEQKKEEGGIRSYLSGLFSGDNIIILALLAFFLLSGKDKGDDNTVLLLLLLLLL